MPSDVWDTCQKNPHIERRPVPSRSPSVCRRCRVGLTREKHGYCPTCAPLAKAAEMRGYNRRFPERMAGDFHGTARWQRVRRAILSREPFCRICAEHGLRTLAEVVDHITPATAGGALYDPENLQPLCHHCHNRKTASEREGITPSKLQREARSKRQRAFPHACAVLRCP